MSLFPKLSALHTQRAQGSERCACGGTKQAHALTCKPCWFRVPKALRQRFFSSERGSLQKRETLREILTIVRQPPRQGPALYRNGSTNHRNHQHHL